MRRDDSGSISSSSLQGQVAIVTGAGRGIGRAISIKLAELGADVILCGRSRRKLEEVAAEIEGLTASEGGRTGTHQARSSASIVECDVTAAASVEALAKHVEADFKRLDILINNAGISGDSGPLLKLSPSSWDDVFNTNLRGVFYCIRNLAPFMIKSGGGHIINISSLAGKNPVPNLSA